MDAGVLIPLGVFAMLVAGWYLQTRANIAHLEALSRVRVAAIEKGVPLPEEKAELPKPPERASHPLKPTLAALAVGIALWVGLAPDHRLWGMVVTAFGIAGLLHWFVAGKDDWKLQRAMEEEMHLAYVQYPEGAVLCRCSGRWPNSLTLFPADPMTRTWNWPGAAKTETLTPSGRSSTAAVPSSIPSAPAVASPGPTARTWPSKSCSMRSALSLGIGGRPAFPHGSIPWRFGASRTISALRKGATCRRGRRGTIRSRNRQLRHARWRRMSRPSGATRVSG